jgi:quinol monooxygenase YgiN
VLSRIIAVSLALAFATAVVAQPPGNGAPSAPAASRADGATTFVVKFKIKAGKAAAFEQAFREMSAGVREHEPGNIYYELYRTNDEPQTYVVLEHYKDAAAVAAHGKSPHAQKLIAALRDMLDGPPQAQRLVFVTSKESSGT